MSARSRTSSPSPSVATMNLSSVHLKPRSRALLSSPAASESLATAPTPSTPSAAFASPANPLASSRVSDPGGLVSSAVRPPSHAASRNASPATSTRRGSGSGGALSDSDAFLKTHASLSSTMHARSRSNSDESRQHPGPLVASSARPPRPSSSGPPSAAASPAVRTPLLVTPSATPGGAGGALRSGGSARASLSLNSDPRPVAPSGKRNSYTTTSAQLSNRRRAGEDEDEEGDYNPVDQNYDDEEGEDKEDATERDEDFEDEGHGNIHHYNSTIATSAAAAGGSPVLPSDVSTYLLESAAKRAQAAEERRRSVHQFMAQQKKERRQRSTSLQIIAAEDEARRKRALSALREEQRIQVQRSLPKSPPHDDDGGATGAFARERLFKSKVVQVGAEEDDDIEYDEEELEEGAEERYDDEEEERMRGSNVKTSRQSRKIQLDPKLASSPYNKPVKGGAVAPKSSSQLQSPRGRATIRLPEKTERLARIANVGVDSDDDDEKEEEELVGAIEESGMSMGDVALLLLERKKADNEEQSQQALSSRDGREVVFSPDSAREQVAQLELLKEQMTDLRNQLASLSVATQLFGASTITTRQQAAQQLPPENQESEESTARDDDEAEKIQMTSIVHTNDPISTTSRARVSPASSPSSPSSVKRTASTFSNSVPPLVNDEVINILPHPSTYIGLSSQESMDSMLSHFKNAVERVAVPPPRVPLPDVDTDVKMPIPSGGMASAYSDIGRIMDAANFGASSTTAAIPSNTLTASSSLDSKRVGTAAVAALAANDPIMALLLDAVFDENDEHSLVNAAAARMSAIAMRAKEEEIEDERRARAAEAAALDALLLEKKPKAEDMEVQTDASTLVLTYVGDSQTLIHHANQSNTSSSYSSSIGTHIGETVKARTTEDESTKSSTFDADHVRSRNTSASNSASNMRLSPDELYHRMIASMDALSAAEEGVAALAALQASQAESAAQRQTLAVAAQWQQQSEAAAIAAQLAELADETKRVLETRASDQQADLQNLYKEHAIQQAEAASDLIKQLAAQAMVQPQPQNVYAHFPAMPGAPSANLATSRSFAGGAGTGIDRQQNLFRPPPPATVSEASYGDYTDEFESEEERTFHEERSRSVHEERSMSSLPVSGRVMTGGSLNNLVSPRSSLAVPQVDAIPEDEEAEEDDIVEEEEEGVSSQKPSGHFNNERPRLPLSTRGVEDEPDGDDGISEDSALLREAEEEAAAVAAAAAAHAQSQAAARARNAEIERQATASRVTASTASLAQIAAETAVVSPSRASSLAIKKTLLKSPLRHQNDTDRLTGNEASAATTSAVATLIDDSLDGEAAVAALLYDEHNANGNASAPASAPESLNVSVDMSSQSLMKRFAADLYSRIKNDHALADLRERALYKASSAELKAINKKIEEVKEKIVTSAVPTGSAESVESARKKAKKELISLKALRKRAVVKHKVKKAEIDRSKAESRVRVYNEMLSIQSDMLKLTRLQLAEGSSASSTTAATSLESSLTNDDTNNILDASATSNEAALLAAEFPGLFPVANNIANNINMRGAAGRAVLPSPLSGSGGPSGAEEALDFLTQALVAWRDHSSVGTSVPLSAASGGTRDLSSILPQRPLPTTTTAGTAAVPLIHSEAPQGSLIASTESGSPKPLSPTSSLASLRAARAPARSPQAAAAATPTVSTSPYVSTPTLAKATAKKDVAIVSPLPLSSADDGGGVGVDDEYEDSFASDSQGSSSSGNGRTPSATPSSIKKDTNRVDSPDAAEVVEEEDMLSSAESSTPTAAAAEAIEMAAPQQMHAISAAQILKTLNVDTSSIAFRSVAVKIDAFDGPLTSFDVAVDLENLAPQVKSLHSSAFKTPTAGASTSISQSMSASVALVDPLSESIGSEELAVLSRPLVQSSSPVVVSSPKAASSSSSSSTSAANAKSARSPHELSPSAATFAASPVSPYGKDDLFIASAAGRSSNNSQSLSSASAAPTSASGIASSNSPVSASFDEEEEEEDLYDFGAAGISPPGSFSNGSFGNSIGLAPRPSAPIGGASATASGGGAGSLSIGGSRTSLSSGMQNASAERSYSLPQPALPSQSQIWEKQACAYVDELLATEDGPAALLGLSIERYVSVNDEGDEMETLQLVASASDDDYKSGGYTSKLPLSIYLNVERTRESLGLTPQDARSAEEMQIRHKLIFDAVNEELPRALSKHKHAVGHLRALAIQSAPVTLPLKSTTPGLACSVGGSLSSILSGPTLKMAEDLLTRVKTNIQSTLSVLSASVEHPCLMDPQKAAQRVDEVVRSELYLQGDEAFIELFQRVSSPTESEQPAEEEIEDARRREVEENQTNTALEDLIATELADELMEEAIDEVLGGGPPSHNGNSDPNRLRPVDIDDIDEEYENEDEIEEDLY